MRQKERRHILVHERPAYREFKVCHLLRYLLGLFPEFVGEEDQISACNRGIPEIFEFLYRHVREHPYGNGPFHIYIPSETSGNIELVNIFECHSHLAYEGCKPCINGPLGPNQVVYINLRQGYLLINSALNPPDQDVFQTVLSPPYPWGIKPFPELPLLVNDPCEIHLRQGVYHP